MIDVEQHLREQLEQLLPAYRPLDWDEVLARSTPLQQKRSRWLLAAAMLAVAGVVAFATPLGATVVRGLGDFSAWLRGEPGAPASPALQRAFERANSRSWLHFPPNTKLRQLARVVVPSLGKQVDLLGFRAGSMLCLRVTVVGKHSASTQSCAPLADLRQAGSPVRVVLVDHGFGQGSKQAWYGVDRFRAPAIQVTAGIAADGVRGLILEDDSGRHPVRTSGNAFLYVAANPDVGQRISRVWAKTSRGLLAVPFAPAALGMGGGADLPRAVPGPTRVERRVVNGTIGWLDRREPRGQPLSVIPGRDGALIRRHAVFGRVVAPDPGRPARVAVTLSTSRRGGRATGLCSWILQRAGAIGGCAVRARIFEASPITYGLSLIGGSDQFATVSGLASDDVARIVAFLADGEQMRVQLSDNAYLIDIARSKLPARLVAYDRQGRVIGLTQPIVDMARGAAPARGKARPLLRAVSPSGTTAQLLVGPSTTGGRCMYVRWHRDRRAGGVMTICTEPVNGSLALGSSGRPAEFVMGRIGVEVARIVLRFADGRTMSVVPRQGFVLVAIPRVHRRAGRELVSAQALDASGRVIGRESFQPRSMRPRP